MSVFSVSPLLFSSSCRLGEERERERERERVCERERERECVREREKADSEFSLGAFLLVLIFRLKK